MTVAPRIAIIGGGLSGLAAAHRLTELARDSGRAVDLTLFEGGARCGGLVGTVEQDGFLIDLGADNFITNKPGAVGLCRRLGLEERLQTNEPRYRGALVLHNGKPYPVPEGFQLLSPSALWPVLKSPILSPWGKLRLACEYFVPARQDRGDESLAHFVRRRFGQEALERLVQPLVGGIYTSDPEKLSLAATLPRFLDMEREYGSLIAAAYAAKPATENEDRVSSGARYGLFVGLRGGMQELVDALLARLQGACRIVLQTPVASLEPLADPAQPESRRWRLTAPDPQEFDAVVAALPARRVAGLVQPFDAAFSAALGGIEYASSAIVVSGHRLADVADPLHAFGLVVPHIERRRILAVSFSSRKFPNRAPDGCVLLRTFVGGALQPELFGLDDAEMERVVREELRDTLGVTGEPLLLQICRYPQSMPQYHLGHLERVAEIERLAAQHARLVLAGNAYHGVGVPDAIFSAEQAAEAVWRQLDVAPAT